MRCPGWMRNIITGPDNETVALGRVMGIIVFVLFIIALPLVSVIVIAKGVTPASEWGVVYDKLPTYLSMILLSIGGLVGLTAFGEPKGPPPPQQKDDA